MDGFRFFFWSNERNEPAHIHVEQQSCTAKFWLSPVSLARARGFNASQLNKLHTIVTGNQTLFLEKWNEFFTR
jgi:uncharacterized protein DUF4160